MRNFNFKYLLIALAVCLSFSSLLNAQPGSPEQLKSKLAEAMKTKDKEEIAALFYWEGVSDEMRQFAESNIEKMVEFPPEKIELLPLPDNFQTEFIKDSVKYIPNIKLLGILRIVYGDEGPESITDASIPYGIKDGKYYLPNTVTEQLKYIGPVDKTININIIGTSASGPVLFEGSCNYTVSGQEKIKPIKGEGSSSVAFWGQEVKSCNIKRVSDSGSMKLIISIDGENIFSSGMKDTPEITYP